MKTPICDFIENYKNSDTVRAHMPGHKGRGLLGFEGLDITEIPGADSLYEANGIIYESEQNASGLFGVHTFYSTEGSSLCIRAMLHLCTIAKEKPLIFAARNAHRSFLSAAALLGADVKWLFPADGETYISCNITPEALEKELSEAEQKPAAVFVTSPDYLGNMLDIKGLSEVCRRAGVLLCVDNAHGAYLKFLPSAMHPMELGADMCCDSAHKTLPVLTGGAYLHVASDELAQYAKASMALFGSTSPSYLILASLDAANKYLAGGYAERLEKFSASVHELKTKLSDFGYAICGTEPLKITVDAYGYGYSGEEIAGLLAKQGIMVEYADTRFVVLMLTEQLEKADLLRIENAFLSIEKRAEISAEIPRVIKPKALMSPSEVINKPYEQISVCEACGRIAAIGVVTCPPAVDIVVGGELIDQEVISVLNYYGKEKINVIK